VYIYKLRKTINVESIKKTLKKIKSNQINLINLRFKITLIKLKTQ